MNPQRIIFFFDKNALSHFNGNVAFAFRNGKLVGVPDLIRIHKENYIWFAHNPTDPSVVKFESMVMKLDPSKYRTGKIDFLPEQDLILEIWGGDPMHIEICVAESREKYLYPEFRFEELPMG